MEFKWIDVNNSMPDEHPITNDYTDTISDKVLVTYKFIDGSSMTDTARTYNGEWRYNDDWLSFAPTIIAWAPMPLPYVEGE
jgi:hypothetical protein